MKRPGDAPLHQYVRLAMRQLAPPRRKQTVARRKILKRPRFCQIIIVRDGIIVDVSLLMGFPVERENDESGTQVQTLTLSFTTRHYTEH